ncbi:hypothetical protein ACJJTC_018243 [Scirpophaga incertulas]
MADAMIEQIYKALRLVPEFDGNSNVLTRFINLCDQLVAQYMRSEPGYELNVCDPDSIEKALEFVHDEMNTLYLQQRNGNVSESKLQYTTLPNQPKFSHSLPPPVALQPSRPFNFLPQRPFNVPGPSRPMITQPQRPMTGWRPQPQFRGPSRTQQMFAAPPPNYKPQSNVFRLPQRQGFQPPYASHQPMSGVTPYIAKQLPSIKTPHDWTKHGNPPPTNYFKTREETHDDAPSPEQENFRKTLKSEKPK